MEKATNIMPNPTETNNEPAATTTAPDEPTWFHVEFVGCMEMLADLAKTIEYFDAHQVWFRQCAHPMKADPIGDNGYALTIGRFGALGYQVEPKIGLNLLPQDMGEYRIETIPVPDYTPPGYEVEFKAFQKLVEVSPENLSDLGEGELAAMTRVEWNLDLRVGVWFPKFIRKLPQSLIRKTGDNLLARIVTIVSRRLTYKVQEDFHSSLGGSSLEQFKRRWSQTKGRDVCQQVNGTDAPEPEDALAAEGDGEDFMIHE
ncbi:MAG TPA: DUF1997 domain-containing protein [Oscillatoriaceae cyanobacterium M33_DOE_052]|uniref:DUF1997 domain-containing protein n=1 Tax=Planktothricoides sp. SpSt-374 TaxID=2282167 RepID=A0A7C3VQP7_9CYAN|nr:DUF1997 domain-containing protein [Oscillatoriaceae cyanobacterium M33_DOE_052]